MNAVRLAVADLRDSWSAWLAVSLTFVATSATIGLCALGLHSSLAAQGAMPKELGQLLVTLSGFNLVLCALVALAVVGSSTGLVVDARKGAVARLLLAGAAPGQVVRLLTLQLAVVTLVCSVVGDLVAVAVQPAVLRAVSEDRGFAPPAALVSPSVLLASSLGCAAVAMLGGLRQARRATRTSPVEAFRDATAGEALRRTPWWRVALRWAGCLLCFGAVAAATAGVAASVGHVSRNDSMTAISQVSALSLPLTGLGFALVAPTIVGPLTRLWSRCVPVPGATWWLARHVVVARAGRIVKSVVPVMFSVGMLFGLTAMSDTLVATFERMGAQDLDGTSAVATFSLLGLPLAIAVAGSVGNLAMMSRQRDAELALDGIIGATPAQQRLLPVLEATLVVGTAAVLGLVMSAVSAAILYAGLARLLPEATFAMPVGMLLAILAGCWLVTVAATLLPSLRSLARPAPKVIARLAAS